MPAPALILDVDGTLVDSNDAHALAWIDAFSEAGVHVAYKDVRRAIGMGGDKLMPLVSGIQKDSPEGRRIADRRTAIFKERYLPGIRPFPRVRDLVARFSRDGFTVVIASSANDEELGPLLERAGVTDLIEARTSSDDAEESKPDPDIVEAALAHARAPREAAIMIGDTPYDAEAARRAGIGFVGVESGGWPREALTGALEVYAAPADLYANYEESIFSRLRDRSQAAERAASGRRGRQLLWMALVPIAAAGAVALVRTLRGRRPALETAAVAGELEDPDDASPSLSRHPSLSARDREALRRIIGRTS
jgi:HAD superfamily hydrolase (TIGR01509 family)